MDALGSYIISIITISTPMKKVLLALLFLTTFYLNVLSQQTVGTFMNTSESFDGYTLFAPISSTETFLIDNCGEKIHSWASDHLPALSCYLLENGILLRTGKFTTPDGSSGIIEMIDWDNNVIWSYSLGEDYGRQHHDIEMLPNGNILIIVRDVRSQEELVQAGGLTENATVLSEQLVEVQPDLVNGGATVVWEWSVWDHLIQDLDDTKDNFGNVSENPEKININFPNHNNNDWLHFNSVSYNAEFDQIIISCRNFNEFWIIDHSTTTAEAAGSTGGTYGQGGDLLYRWGNPRAYGQGTAADRKLFLQHDTHWIKDGFSDAGKILLFNNQPGSPEGLDYSTVDIVETPVDANGFYNYNGGAFGPADFAWTYQASNPTDFYSKNISGVQRLENGNTLVCQGDGGRFFEINPSGEMVWEYINPMTNEGATAQYSTVEGNNVFRCTKYAPDYPGFDGQTLSPQGYLETSSDIVCDLQTSSHDAFIISNIEFNIFPNPTKERVNVEIQGNFPIDDIKQVSIYNMNAAAVYQSEKWEKVINLEKLAKGTYFIRLDLEYGEIVKKIIIQ